MAQKITFLLLFIFAGLTTLYLMNANNNAQSDPFFPGLTEAAIDSLDIDFFTQGTQLVKKNNIWMVSERKNELAKKIDTQEKPQLKKDNLPIDETTNPEPANQDYVLTVINSLIGLQRETLVSSNRDKQGLFEVTSAGLTVTVHLKDGRNEKIIIGKQGPTPFSTYVRLAGENKVYLVSYELAGFFNKTLADWKKPEDQK